MLSFLMLSSATRGFLEAGSVGMRTAAMRRPAAARLASSVSMAAEGPVCIVTGGSRGLGRAIALSLGGEGCRVVVNYAASAAAAESVVEEIKALGGDGIAVQADMSSLEGINSLFKATAEAYSDPVGVLVNNAGITRDTLTIRMKPDQWHDVINTNLNGVFFSSQARSRTRTWVSRPGSGHERSLRMRRTTEHLSSRISLLAPPSRLSTNRAPVPTSAVSHLCTAALNSAGRRQDHAQEAGGQDH